jgi:cytochrome c-type biogenesis protein CcmE
MPTRKVRSRVLILFAIIILTIIILLLSLKSLEDNVVYFFSPTDVYNNDGSILKSKIRIGGMVKKNSLNTQEDSISFVVTDFTQEIYVTYSGSIPNLFSEEKGVVVEGRLEDKKYFVADRILAKHDENYMPPEVSQALNRNKDQQQ